MAEDQPNRSAPDEAPSLIPPSIALAWGRQPRRTRGPRPALTLELIVAAGIAVARTEGIAALSMARVARELGVGTMSLYRYVDAKDDLLTLMVDDALGSPPPPARGEDWRAGLTRWARGIRDAYRRHPWSLRVPITSPPLGPNNVAWLEDGLRSLSGTSLSEQQKLSTVLLLSGFVRNDATLDLDLTTASGGEMVMPGYVPMLRELIAGGSYPALERAVASGALEDDDDPELEFGFGLDRLLDGVGLLIDGLRRDSA